MKKVGTLKLLKIKALSKIKIKKGIDRKNINNISGSSCLQEIQKSLYGIAHQLREVKDNIDNVHFKYHVI